MILSRKDRLGHLLQICAFLTALFIKILIIDEKPAEYGQKTVRNGETSKGGM